MGKAEEFLEAADAEFAAGRLVPATSLAVHATINAGDVAAGLRSGQRAAGQGHDQALTLLEASGSDGRAVARELRRLLPLKNRAEYEHRGISRNDAQRALRAAAPRSASPGGSSPNATPKLMSGSRSSDT